MIPQLLSHAHERGYYIVWDTLNWRKERVSDGFDWYSTAGAAS